MSRTSFTEWSPGLVGDVRRRKVEFRRWSTTKSLRQAVLGPRSSGCPQDCSGDVPDSDQNLNLDSCDLGSQCKFKTLSAESSFDSRSEGSGSSEEEVASAISFSSINWISIRVPKCLLVESIFSIRITSFIAVPQVTINSLPVRRKLATALSVPAYITSYAGRWVEIGESVKSWCLKKKHHSVTTRQWPHPLAPHPPPPRTSSLTPILLLLLHLPLRHLLHHPTSRCWSRQSQQAVLTSGLPRWSLAPLLLGIKKCCRWRRKGSASLVQQLMEVNNWTCFPWYNQYMIWSVKG